MNTDQNGSLILMGAELEYVSGGVPYSPNGEIFSAGMEMVTEGKDMMKNGNNSVGAFFGFGQTIIGGWYLVIGGTADWIGSWF